MPQPSEHIAAKIVGAEPVATADEFIDVTVVAGSIVPWTNDGTEDVYKRQPVGTYPRICIRAVG